MNDIFNEGRFVWEGTGAVATYTNWTSGQPDNYLSNENCATILYGSGQWNDINCNVKDPKQLTMCERVFPPGNIIQDIINWKITFIT